MNKSESWILRHLVANLGIKLNFLFLLPIESSTEEEATKDDDTATDSSEDSDSDVSASTASDSSVTESRSGSSPSSMSKESQPSTRRRRVSSSYSGKILFIS